MLHKKRQRLAGSQGLAVVAIAAIVILAMTLVIGMATGAKASLIQQDLSPVRFFVVDDNSDPAPDGNDSVTLTGWGFLPLGWSLEWSNTDSDPWTKVTDLATGVNVQTGSDDWELVYFRIVNGSGVEDNTANLTFCNPEGQLWNSVRIDWFENDPWYSAFTFLGANDDDNVAPVPISSSVLLLGSGLIGFVGLRRKFNKN